MCMPCIDRDYANGRAKPTCGECTYGAPPVRKTTPHGDVVLRVDEFDAREDTRKIIIPGSLGGFWGGQ